MYAHSFLTDFTSSMIHAQSDTKGSIDVVAVSRACECIVSSFAKNINNGRDTGNEACTHIHVGPDHETVAGARCISKNSRAAGHVVQFLGLGVRRPSRHNDLDMPPGNKVTMHSFLVRSGGVRREAEIVNNIESRNRGEKHKKSEQKDIKIRNRDLSLFTHGVKVHTFELKKKNSDVDVFGRKVLPLDQVVLPYRK